MRDIDTPPPIIVGYDGTTDATVVLDWALAEAGRRSVPVRVVVGQTPLFTSGYGLTPFDPAPDAFARSVEAVAVASTAAAMQHATEVAPDIPVHTATGVGTAARLLVEASQDAQLVVVGRGHHRALHEALVGSTSAQVVAHAHCPVVVVDVMPVGDSRAAIVVGVDSGPDGDAVIEYAFEAARAISAEVIAVHSWWSGAQEETGLALYDGALVVDLQEHAETLLSEALAGWRAKYPEILVQERVTRQPPVAALVEAGSDATLLVVGSRGHGGFVGLLLGSVSQGLLHHARSCPLVVVHPHRSGAHS